MFRRVTVVLAALVAMLAARALPAAAAPASSCSSLGITATSSTWVTVGLPVADWLENLSFDGRGGMWVSELEQGKIVRFDASAQPGTSVAVSSPGATVLRSDGTMDAVFGDSDLNVLPGSSSGVETFDPQAAAPAAQPFASGLTMGNGAALDGAGNLYVADTMKPGIVKLSPTGNADPAFAAATRISGADGVAVSGQTLYVTQLTSAGAAIVEVPLTDPGNYTVLSSLAPAIGPDDLTVGPDGALYVAMVSGQIIRVDTTTGAACVVASTGVPATSVRFAAGFPPYSPTADAFVTSEEGKIVLVHISGLKATVVPGRPPAVSPAAMRLAVRPGRVPARRTVTVRATVRSAAAACRSGVLVRVGRRSARTGAGGRATLKVRFARAGKIGITARKSGCVPATAMLRVTRPHA